MKMLDKKIYDSIDENAWCPGCGNFGILDAFKEVLAELEIHPHEMILVSGIGQAAKTPHYVNANVFNGLHGRALPPAFGAKVANKDMRVIVTSGEGDTYGEGGNHLIHNMRRNIDIAHFVHNNQIYGLTKGQGSPTTAFGQITTLQLDGVYLNPFNPLSFAISQGASFVARSFSGNKEHLKMVMREAILHKGYALVDILQPCVTFNKVNTFKWYKENTYELGEDYDFTNRDLAMKMALTDEGKLPMGILYKKEQSTYIERRPMLNNGGPLIEREWSPKMAEKFMAEFK